MSTRPSTYDPPVAPRPPRRRGGVVGPLVLIFLGSIFLLQNAGYLPPNFWQNLWRLWPLVLVLAGIELLLAPRIPRAALAGLAAIVLVLGAAIASSNWTNAPAAAALSQSTRTNLGGATQANVTVRFGAGQLDIGPLVPAVPDQLASMTYEGPADLMPQPRYTAAAGGVGQLEYQVGGRGGPAFMPFAGGHSDAVRMSLNLNPDVPITMLTVQTGATDARLDLSTLKVSSLDMSVGAAAASVRLPRIDGTAAVHVSGGAATLTLDVPQGVAAMIRHRGGLSTVTVDTSRFPQIGEGQYQSPDYASATSKVDITLETGITTIQVK